MTSFAQAFAQAIVALIAAMVPTLFTDPAAETLAPPPPVSATVIAEQHPNPIRCAQSTVHDGGVIIYEFITSASVESIMAQSLTDPNLFCQEITDGE